MVCSHSFIVPRACHILFCFLLILTTTKLDTKLKENGWQSSNIKRCTTFFEGFFHRLLLLTKATKRKRWPTNIKDIWNLQSGTRIVVDVNQYGQPIRKEIKSSIFSKATKRKRWPTNIKDIWNLQSGTRIVVDVNQYGQPIRKEIKSSIFKAKKEGCEPSHLEQFRFQYLRKDKSDKLSSEAVEQVYAKDSMPTPGSSFMTQYNVALENELYTQVFGLDKYGKVLGFRREAAEREARLISEEEERFMKLTKIREAKFMDMMDAREKKYKALLNKCMAKGMSNK
ncbi:hypothetical protein GOBAR_DD26377 [Gossypium barbadense]|nr:hypothetical protein GOBAR_DD26377 [Gossypium barbadense]